MPQGGRSRVHTKLAVKLPADGKDTCTPTNLMKALQFDAVVHSSTEELTPDTLFPFVVFGVGVSLPTVCAR